MGFEPEEFVVEEITKEGEILEIGKKCSKPDEENVSPNYFSSKFVLQKRLWTTPEALKEIAGRLGVSQKRLNAAGNKDRNALTTQLCSAFAVEPDKILALKIKDIEINGAWKSAEKARIGELAGNRFTITLNERNCGTKISLEKIVANAEENKYAIPNFFGAQRFGSTRKNTATVGKLLLQGRHEEAVMNYLCAPGDEDENASAARRKLIETKDFKTALRDFPRHLKPERRILAHLCTYPTDFLGAFRKLHRSAQLLFIHAVQSELFNKMAKKRLDEGTFFRPKVGDKYCGNDATGFPDLSAVKKIVDAKHAFEVANLIEERKAVLVGNVIGYETELNDGEKTLLEIEGLSKEAFKPKSLPELSAKGTIRPMFVFLKGLEATDSEKGVVVRFSLPSGSYATVAIDQLLAGNQDVL